MSGVMRRCQVFVVLVVAALLTAENGNVDAFDQQPGDVVAFLDMADTPQVPDGPVVQNFNKMVAKKKMTAELAKQKQLMGPQLDAEEAARKAKSMEMEMMAEVVIKGRVAKKEVKLKRDQKAQDDEDKAREKIAKARRTERYVKLNEGAVQRENERLAKLHKHTTHAFHIIKKLFKRKKSTAKTAMVAMAKAKAAQKMELTVGGYLNLKGNQINMETLTALNDKLAAAMNDPTNMNIHFAQAAFERAALAVTQDQQAQAAKEIGWKDEEKQQKEIEEKREQAIQKEKLEKLAAKVAQEKFLKNNRELEVQQKAATNEANEKRKWKDAVDLVKKQRAQVTASEAKVKSDFLAKLGGVEKAKKAAAPGELVQQKQLKYQERSEKYANSEGSGEVARASAKIMKKRACEEFKQAENALNAMGKPVDEQAQKTKEAADSKECAADA